ncbi:cyclin-L2 [Anopheles marshallii]|uniref:cyclin-L2 n=1 Tax=Anopheles marshallii TaxID=1521116 RepID=UPI00237C1B7F|nr:cyclin-L2 [Anopheles marshallii]
MSVSKTITETVTSNKTASAVIAAQAPAATGPTPVQRPYGKIVLTLENCLLPEVKLDQTPSQNDGLDRETETDLRILGCELIQTAGILLKLPQVAMATGQVLFQRFFYSKSFVRHSMEATAMSCICLASKIEEAPRRIRDVINVFHHIKQVRSQKPMMPMILDQHYINLKSQVIKAERRVLKELGFCVHVKHPHKLIVMYLKYLELEKHQNMMQMAWNFMNDSFRTDVFVRYQPETIACACIYLTARKHNIPLPSSPPWFVIFRVSEDDMLDVCYRIMALYKRGKPNAEQLEEAVEALKKKYQEQRKKDRPEANPAAAAPTVITVDRNNGSHNAWGGFIQRAMPLPLNSSGNASNANSGGSNAATAGGVAGGGTNANSNNAGLNNNESDAGGPTADGKKSRSRSKSLSKSSRSKSRSPRSMSRSMSRSRSRGTRSRSRTSHSRSRSKTRTSRSRSRSVVSRSRSRSRSPHSPHYPTEKGGSRRTSKKSRHRSRTPTKISSSAKKKSSRHYSSRSPSPESPQKYKKSDKKYDRRSGRGGEDRNNDNRYTNGSERDRDRSKGTSNSLDHSRNRDRDRDRMRSDGGKVGSGGGGGYDRDDYRRSEKDYRGNGKHDKYGSSRHSDSSSRHRSSKHERERSRDRDRDRRR